MPVGEKSTGESIFLKHDEFLKKENLTCSKCVNVTTDGAAVMKGKHKEVTAHIKENSKN